MIDPPPHQSFRDIKALKAIASRSMPPVRGAGAGGSKKQPPTVGAQFQVGCHFEVIF